MPVDHEFDRFLSKSRALTSAPEPNRVEQAQKVVKSQIQTSVRKPLYSFLVVLTLVSIYLAWTKPRFVTRYVLPSYNSYGMHGQQGYSPNAQRQFNYVQWAKSSFCLSVLLWVCMYLIFGAMTTSSSSFKDADCSDGDEPDSGGYCSS